MTPIPSAAVLSDTDYEQMKDNIDPFFRKEKQNKKRVSYRQDSKNNHDINLAIWLKVKIEPVRLPNNDRINGVTSDNLPSSIQLGSAWSDTIRTENGLLELDQNHTAINLTLRHLTGDERLRNKKFIDPPHIFADNLIIPDRPGD